MREQISSAAGINPIDGFCKLPQFSCKPNFNMAEHKSAIEDFGNNDDFWLFGYGYA
jgi:hypothetical protein